MMPGAKKLRVETRKISIDAEAAHSISKRGRVGEGRPTLYTPELANRLADHIAAGRTDEEAAALEGISSDCINRWRKSNREFCEAVKKGGSAAPETQTDENRGRRARVARDSLGTSAV
jgi:hypothetical protein